jgi:hypothetical protein
MILSVNSVNLLIFVVVKCCVLFEVRTEFLNSIQKTSAQVVNRRHSMGIIMI